MIPPQDELIAVIRQMNPWWRGAQITDLPTWRRAAFRELFSWILNPPTHRALLLNGARQIGKTTLLLQAIEALLEEKIPPANIVYVTFDHPLLKLLTPDEFLKIWRQIETAVPGVEYVFFDEIQYIPNWQVWLKHQTDFEKHRRITATGSATPLNTELQESGVGRWHTINLATLSFFEYTTLKNIRIPELPGIRSLSAFFEMPKADLSAISFIAEPLTGIFHDYLLRGGFPETVKVDSLTVAQKLLREDIVDKVLKRDMTALYGVRRVRELEQVFLYLCLHDGGLLDIKTLCDNLADIKKPTALNFINLLEATHLIYLLKPHGYGKEILRGKPKAYLADPAIAHAVLMRGKTMLEDERQLGKTVETAVFRHIYARYYSRSVDFSYWRGRGNKAPEVDIIAEIEGRIRPFEVKYQRQINRDDFKGLIEFGKLKHLDRGYMITRNMTDFFVAEFDGYKILQIPAPLACYWLGKSEMIDE